MRSIENKLNAHRQDRLADAGDLAIVDPESLELADAARFNSAASALRITDPIRYMAMQRKLLSAFYKSAMIRGQDYGTIPGCGEKPALYKAGAEKVASFFNLSIHVDLEKDHEDWEKELFAYTYKATIKDIERRVLAECIGNCNSKESKYRWRTVGESYATPKQKEAAVERFKPKGKDWWVLKIPNDDICSQVNTLIKMAQKRAIVGGILLATNCSAFFHNAELEISNAEKEISDHPSWDAIDVEVVPDKAITPAQLKRLHAIAGEAGHNKESAKALLASMGIPSSKEVLPGQYDLVCTQLANKDLAKLLLASGPDQAGN